jgi:hypothetical protein
MTSSRDVAEAKADKEKAKIKAKAPVASQGFRIPNDGTDDNWSKPPFYRGGPRPPRVNTRTGSNSVDTDGNKRQFFNPKAQLDPSGIEDRRMTSGWSQPKGGFGIGGQYHLQHEPRKFDPNFKFPENKKYPKGPPPKSKSDTDDMTSSRVPPSKMEQLIALEYVKKRQLQRWLEGRSGQGQ